jgi:hypothetical protein
MAHAATYSARDVAKALAKSGRKVDGKRVRQWVRDHVARFDDDGYTAHQYTAAEYRTIVAGMTGTAKTGRSTAARQGRAGKPRTVKRTAPADPETPTA